MKEINMWCFLCNLEFVIGHKMSWWKWSFVFIYYQSYHIFCSM